jgi:Protein of unknown function (DUF3800)
VAFSIRRQGFPVLVFIDESGDPGFDVSRGASPIFAVGMVIFNNHDEASRTQNLIGGAVAQTQAGREFKFNKCSPDRRDGFFRLVAQCDFRVRAIVVQKEKIRSDKLRSEPQSFYNFFLKSMLRFDNQTLQEAKVIIDGSGNALFRSNLKKYISANTAVGTIRSVTMRESHREPLLQLADMAVGAIARSYRPDRADHMRWLQQLRPKIDNVWPFR